MFAVQDVYCGHIAGHISDPINLFLIREYIFTPALTNISTPRSTPSYRNDVDISTGLAVSFAILLVVSTVFSAFLAVYHVKSKQKIGNTKSLNEAADSEGENNKIQPEQMYENVTSPSPADVETDKNIAYDIVHASKSLR